MSARRTWTAIGTTVEVLAEDDHLAARAAARVAAQLAELDQACSRFRPDSELRRLPVGTITTVGPVLSEAIAAALRTARVTQGLVDPTVGSALRALGYDADLDQVRRRPPSPTTPFPVRAPGYRRIWHDRATRQVRIPAGIELDLGASAKAWAADRAAAACAAALPGRFLVNLGGDIATAGPGGPGWRIALDDGDPADRPLVRVRRGGLATSSTVCRTWSAGGAVQHHIIDPRTGAPAAPAWRAVSVVAGSCEQANAATTAAVVLGAQAPLWLRRRGLHARLVDRAGRVFLVGAWPTEHRAEVRVAGPPARGTTPVDPCRARENTRERA